MVSKYILTLLFLGVFTSVTVKAAEEESCDDRECNNKLGVPCCNDQYTCENNSDGFGKCKLKTLTKEEEAVCDEKICDASYDNPVGCCNSNYRCEMRDTFNRLGVCILINDTE